MLLATLRHCFEKVAEHNEKGNPQILVLAATDRSQNMENSVLSCFQQVRIPCRA